MLQRLQTSMAYGLSTLSLMLFSPVLFALEDNKTATVEKAAATKLVESPITSANIVDTAVGLIVVLALMLGLAWLFKRFFQVPGMGRGNVQVIGGVSLGQREKAILLSVEGRRLLVGVAPGRVNTLLELDGEAPVDNEFADTLQQVNQSTGETA